MVFPRQVLVKEYVNGIFISDFLRDDGQDGYKRRAQGARPGFLSIEATRLT
jgi:hypothetical protein